MYAIIHPITPFDVANGTTISFTWNGNQIYKVRCIIKENESGTTVYDKTISTMKASYTIEENSGLTNGTYYIMYITVFDINDNESDLQNIGTPFYCFSTPTFSLSISPGQIIQTSSYSVSLTYDQAEDELLDSYEIMLYSYQNILLQSSGTLYNTDNLTYLLSGMENAMQYYVRAIGTTLHGITLDTGYIPFNVAYTLNQTFYTMELNNMPEIGGIELRSNIISTEGESESEVIYIDNKYADLRNNSVTFDVGYIVDGDNSHVFSFYEPVLNACIATIRDEKNKTLINCYYREGSFEDSNGKKAVIELNIDIGGINYVIYSNYINIPNNNQNITVCVSRVDNHFDITAVLTLKDSVTTNL